MSLTARSVAAPLKRVAVWMIDSCSFLFVFTAGRAGSKPAQLWMTLCLLPVNRGILQRVRTPVEEGRVNKGMGDSECPVDEEAGERIRERMERETGRSC